MAGGDEDSGGGAGGEGLRGEGGDDRSWPHPLFEKLPRDPGRRTLACAALILVTPAVAAAAVAEISEVLAEVGPAEWVGTPVMLAGALVSGGAAVFGALGLPWRRDNRVIAAVVLRLAALWFHGRCFAFLRRSGVARSEASLRSSDGRPSSTVRRTAIEGLVAALRAPEGLSG